MSVLVVVERPEDWPLAVPGVELVPARRYLTDSAYDRKRGTRVFNLCRRYRYQSVGYYVSLLAAARGQKPLPSVATIQDLRHQSLVRLISEDLAELIDRTFHRLTGQEFTVSVYFGRNVNPRYDRLALQLFNLFPAPLLRAVFRRNGRSWQLESLRPIAAREIPEHHWEFVVTTAQAYLNRRARPSARPPRFDLAILVNPEEKEPPSDEDAIKRFVKAGREAGFWVEVIEPQDIGRIAEFDALFIRETTRVNHHTYRFARRADAEGLVVIDDPDSIVRCCNKVYLAEVLERAKIPGPKTVIVHRDNVEEAGLAVGYPSILKRPDSSFSLGVVRLENAAEFAATARQFLETSELLIAQEFLPTDFDWRVGVLDRKPLFAARYHMARQHWQIIKRDARGKIQGYGGADAVPIEAVPKAVLEPAMAAANMMGDGFYGVDLKEKDGRGFLIEVNDNPNVDGDVEDKVIGEELYRRIMAVFLERVERAKAKREGT